MVEEKLAQCRELEVALLCVREAGAALGIDDIGGPAQARSPSRPRRGGASPSGTGPRARAEGARRRGNPSRAEVLEHVKAHGPVRRSQVQAALGGSADAIGDMLRRMAAAGLLVPEGVKNRRAYRVAAPELAVADDERSACADAESMLALIARSGPISSQRIHELTGASLIDISNWGIELMCRSLVVPIGEGGARAWRMAPSDDLSAAVLATIAARPGVLGERAIALSLRAPHDRVGMTCAELLDRGKIALTERNTYVPLDDPAASRELAA